MRDRLALLVESELFQNIIIGVIVINAGVIGLETWSEARAVAGGWLRLIDSVALCIFVVELAIKLLVHGRRFFKDAWNIFDFAVVGAAFMPASAGVSVMRALRILRAFRLISAIPKMRLVVQALLSSVPAMTSVIGLLGVIFYVSAVMATHLFAADFPNWFGSIGRSLFSLFQIMTLESWSMGMVRPIMDLYPYAWLFFVPFILVTTFAVLNLFIAIIVNAMHEAAEEKDDHDAALRSLAAEVSRLRAKIDALNVPPARQDTSPRSEALGALPDKGV